MNFLVDAQLPQRMIAWLTAAGCSAVHTLDLPDGNRTTDEQINDMADREQRVGSPRTPTSSIRMSSEVGRRSCC
jgi:predicted nuclease of predicted toxin-antitoxin system